MNEPLDYARRRCTREQDIWIDDAGIVWCVHRPKAVVDLDEARATIAALVELGGRVARPALIDMRGAISVSREARHYLAGPEPGAVTLAAAFLVSSPISRAIANFFMGLNRPAVPTKVFDSERAAYEWLRSMLP